MKINFGRLKGKSISYNVPEDVLKNVKPTSSIVKSVLFNLLAHNSNLDFFKMEGAKVADICCGSGSVGFEFLSLGASGCDFFDLNYQNLLSITNNAKNLDLQDCVSTKQLDIFSNSQTSKAFLQNYDVIFFDPPYKQIKESLSSIINIIVNNNILKQKGILIVESESKLTTDLLTILLERRVRKDRWLTFFIQK